MAEKIEKNMGAAFLVAMIILVGGACIFMNAIV